MQKNTSQPESSLIFTPVSGPATSPVTPPPPATYWQLLGSEPFRLLFPIGLIIGIIGISLWPLHFAGVWKTFPGIPHARIMFEAFMTSFVIGFLGTAMPRILTAPRLTKIEVFVAVGFLLAITSSHLLGATATGDLFFACLLVLVLSAFGVRAVFRRNPPPPGFVLVAFGMACALVGAITLAVEAAVQVSPYWDRLGKLFVYQGYILFPVMGIGAFLFPRFFGLKSPRDPENPDKPARSWGQRARFAALCGVVVMASFFVEAAGFVRAGNVLRVIGFAGFVLREVPFFKDIGGNGSMSLCLKSGLILLMLGFVAQALFPGYVIGLEHVLYMGGFSLVTLTVATRVVLGHCGFSHLFKERQVVLLIMAGCIVIGMISRIVGDFMPRVQTTHYLYGAVCWIAGSLLWGFKILPKVRFPDTEETLPRHKKEASAFPACSHSKRKG